MNRNKYDNVFLGQAHERSIFHEKEINESQKCGCFYCKNIFESKRITEWVDEQDFRGKTALCPNCGIDSVLSDKLPIEDKEFLRTMNKKYFS